MRYRLIPNREGWPDEIPVCDGQYDYDLDVIEEEVDQDWIREKRFNCYLSYRKKYGEPDRYKLNELSSKPMGFNKPLPKEMELIPDETHDL